MPNARRTKTLQLSRDEGERLMNRAFRVFGWLFILFLAHALIITRAIAQPTISNAECFCVTINQPGVQPGGNMACGTENSQFTFRASVNYGTVGPDLLP